MNLTYRCAIVLARVAFALLGLRITVVGDERVPRTGPVVLAANHVSVVDFVLVGLAARRSRRLVRFLCRGDVFDHRLAGPTMRAMGHVPVVRDHGAGAFLRARQLLGAGEAVGVFPEGGVSRAFVVRPLLRGAVALARDTGAPLVPVVVWGPQRLWPVDARPSLRRGRAVTVVVGEPMTVSPDADLVACTRRLRATLQTTLDAAQERHADQPAPGEHAPWHPAHRGGDAPSPAGAVRLEDRPRGAVDGDSV